MKSSAPEYLASIPTSDGVIEQGLLDIENKERSNLFAWSGQFSPQLVEVLLDTYAPKNAKVLDIFAGSGTVLYECGRGGLRGIAAEINPAAFYLTRAYTFMNLRPAERFQPIECVDNALSPILMGGLELWSNVDNTGVSTTKRKLVDLWNGMEDPWAQTLSGALLVLADFGRLESATDVARTWAKLKAIVENLPYSPEPLDAVNCDARNLPLPQDFIDLVITSPPYINVFNYHQQYRASTEALGWDLLKVAKAEIGSNRKHRSNRFLTVIQYCLDITMALSEINRVCKPSAKVVFVVGRESMVRGVRFFNGEIVGRLASRCTSLRVESRQERSFRNRFGDLIIEDILHFGLAQSRKRHDLFNIVDARDVAADVLRRATSGAMDATVAKDIDEALNAIGEVEPSPIFCADSARKVSLTD